MSDRLTELLERRPELAGIGVAAQINALEVSAV